MLQVNASLIRFWEKEFDILKPKKNSKGDRMFTKADIANLKTIYYLVKEKGYTLQGAKEKLKSGKADVSGNVEIVRSLEEVKRFLLEIKKEL